VICPTQVNCRRHRHPHRAKRCCQAPAKRHAAGCFHLHLEHTDRKAAGVQAGTKSLVSFKRNKVSPMSRPFTGAGVAVRHAVEAAGKGGWRKRMPLCNGADRSCDITPLRKQADFQQVVVDEKTYRIFEGGNRK